MYLFVFAVLFIIYQYMNEKNIFETQEAKIESLTSKLNTTTDSISELNDKIASLNYFSFIGNDNAMSYIENLGFNAAEIEAYISNQVYDQNLVKGNNPLVPFDGINGDMKINKIKFLNHKWIQADFTDGKYWGEMILEFYIDKNRELELTTISSLLYPIN